MDFRPGALQRNIDVETNCKTRVDFPKMGSVHRNQGFHRRESSIVSHESDDGYDMYTFRTFLERSSPIYHIGIPEKIVDK